MIAPVDSPIRRPSLLKALGVVVCMGLALSASGCAQFVLLGLLLGGPPSIEPDFDRETGLSMSKKDTKVVVVCYAPTELKWNFPSVDDEVAAHVSYRLHEHNIKGVIEPDYVRAWVDQHPDWEVASDIGKAFDATYVIEIELTSFSLYEEGNTTSLYRGKTVGCVHVCDMKNDGERIFSKEVDFSFPTHVPRSAYDQSLVSFKREYLSRLSEDIGFMFYERYHGDKMGWAN
jgi:hypothetical protein